MRFLAWIVFVVVIGGLNGLSWLWCKATGRHYEPFGGPQ